MSEKMLKVGEQEVDVTIRRRFGIRNLSMRLDFSRRLYVSAPRFMSEKRIVDFLEDKENWILKNLQKIDDLNSEKDACRRHFKDGERFRLLGQKYRLDVRFTSRKRPRVFLECTDSGEEVVVLEVHEAVQFRDLAEVGRAAMEKFYKSYAKDYFVKRLKELNTTHYRFRYNKVTVKNQKTRYGSCSSKGNLNFNWKIVMASKEVVDYVLIHELCHLKEMNHSDRFWKLVEKADPEYKKHRSWLKRYGHTLLV